MNRVLEKYGEETDGIYLFDNDSVLDYYPCFGFKAINEYEYFLGVNIENPAINCLEKYVLEKVNISIKRESEAMYNMIQLYSQETQPENQNDSMNMCDNLGLYQFWLNMQFTDDIYFLPEPGAYVIASMQQDELRLVQIISDKKLDMNRLALSFDEGIRVMKLGYTPASKEQYNCNIIKKMIVLYLC